MKDKGGKGSKIGPIERLESPAELRLRAEEELRARAGPRSTSRNLEERQRFVHELEVHQIELEMQNAELSQARDELETTLDKYTDLYDFAPVGYLTLDHHGAILAANLTAAGLLGIDRWRLTGRRFGLIVAGPDRPAFADFLRTVFSHRRKQACEVLLLNSWKQSVAVQVEALAAASGLECRAVLIDISLRREQELQLKALHAELAVRADELAAANIELEAFNYTVSHELRQPLTIIQGYAQVLKELWAEQPDEPSMRYLNDISAGTVRMSRVIESLLEFSPTAYAQQRRETVDLSALAREAAFELRELAPDRKVVFRIEEEVRCCGDPDLWRIVLGNLLGNAWKFTGAQEKAIIEFGVAEASGKPVGFVRDNGPGFDMALADQVFIPFRQLPGTDTDGYGIGLATVERIIRRQGGRIWAESAPGQGATFLFTLE